MTARAHDASPRRRRWPRLRVVAIWVAATVLVLSVGGFLFAASGLYNVAASKGHFAVTELFIEFALRRSIATHSMGVEAPPLGDPDLLQLGAGHFESGCAPCHGTPGEPNNPIVRRMLPAPPPLSEAVAGMPADEMFWIVKHGLKYTGMPAWVSQERDDEVWAVVAFLRALPDMEAEDYRALAMGNVDAGSPAAERPPGIGGFGAGGACARCHGDETRPPVSRLVPKLAGQSAAYLEAALESYAAGQRASGIMQPIAAQLDREAIGRIAERYAGMSRERDGSPPEAAAAEQLARGRRIATSGIPDSGIPPCLACHDGTAAATFPLLAGQHASYLAGQLRLWQHGLRDRTAHGAIMATIARRLTAQQIEDVTAWLESAGDGAELDRGPAAALP